MSLSHTAHRALTKSLSSFLRLSPAPEGIRLRIDDEGNVAGEGGVKGLVRGSEGTPYAGGYFIVHFNFLGMDYPNEPPKCKMITKIFHPNISKSGEICVDTLKKAWNRKLGIADILLTIKCLLINPNPESALDEEAGKLLLEDYEEYARMASLMTQIHAIPRTPPPEFADEIQAETQHASSSQTQAISTPASTSHQPVSTTPASPSEPHKPRPTSSTHPIPPSSSSSHTTNIPLSNTQLPPAPKPAPSLPATTTPPARTQNAPLQNTNTQDTQQLGGKLSGQGVRKKVVVGGQKPGVGGISKKGLRRL